MPFRSEQQRRWMWANKPDIAQRWTDEYGPTKYGSKQIKKEAKMPRKPATPLKGPIVKGTGKAIIAREGGGRKALRTWRSLSKDQRKILKANDDPGVKDTTYTLAEIRAARIGRGQRASTGKDMPGFKANVRQLKGLAERKRADATTAAKRKFAPANKTVAKVSKDETLASSYKARMKKMGKI